MNLDISCEAVGMHISLSLSINVCCYKPTVRQRQRVVEIVREDGFIVSCIVKSEPLPIHPGRQIGSPTAYRFAPYKIEAEGCYVDIYRVHDKLKILFTTIASL